MKPVAQPTWISHAVSTAERTDWAGVDLDKSRIISGCPVGLSCYQRINYNQSLWNLAFELTYERLTILKVQRNRLICQLEGRPHQAGHICQERSTKAR